MRRCRRSRSLPSTIPRCRAFCRRIRRVEDDKTAATKLMQKVKAGGSGVWGQVPMPPNPQVKDDDLKKMVDYVLALK